MQQVQLGQMSSKIKKSLLYVHLKNMRRPRMIPAVTWPASSHFRIWLTLKQFSLATWAQSSKPADNPN